MIEEKIKILDSILKIILTIASIVVLLLKIT